MPEFSTENQYVTDAMELIKGSIDIHIHSFPDVVPRKRNDIEVAQDAREAGMKAVLLASHTAPTEGRAYLAQQAVPEVMVFGGVVLNAIVGGLNPAAVQISAKLGGKQVVMPTVSSANLINFSGRSSFLSAVGGGVKEEGVVIIDEKGRLKNEVFEILALIKEHDLILSTGGISVEESLKLVDAALRIGIDKIMWPHPEAKATFLPVEKQQVLAAQGVYFERLWSITSTFSAGKEDCCTPAEIARNIKIVGPASTVMASDGGMVKNPPPVEGLIEFIASMLSFGVTSKEIEVMIKINPAQLLGIA